jgi:hypothetical protein
MPFANKWDVPVEVSQLHMKFIGSEISSQLAAASISSASSRS